MYLAIDWVVVHKEECDINCLIAECGAQVARLTHISNHYRYTDVLFDRTGPKGLVDGFRIAFGQKVGDSLPR